MSQRGPAKFDPFCWSRVINMLVKRMMKHGKKSLAYQTFYRAAIDIRQQTKQNPVYVLRQAISRVIPGVRIIIFFKRRIRLFIGRKKLLFFLRKVLILLFVGFVIVTSSRVSTIIPGRTCYFFRNTNQSQIENKHEWKSISFIRQGRSLDSGRFMLSSLTKSKPIKVNTLIRLDQEELRFNPLMIGIRLNEERSNIRGNPLFDLEEDQLMNNDAEYEVFKFGDDQLIIENPEYKDNPFFEQDQFMMEGFLFDEVHRNLNLVSISTKYFV